MTVRSNDPTGAGQAPDDGTSEETAMIESRRDRKLWALAASVAPLVVLVLAFLFQPGISYNRWDNFEGFTPAVAYAHGQLLKGIFPHWNPHQFLGEPLHAMTQTGVLYLPYTAALLLLRLMGVGPEWLTLAILVFHLPFAALGWFWLLSRHGVRPVFSWITSLSTTCGGFLTAVASVWMFVVPVFTWLPWLLLGLVRILEEPGKRRHQLLFVAGLTAVAYIGYAQLLVYVWVLAALVAVTYAFIVFRRPGRLAYLLVPALVAALLSAPALLPTYNLLQYTQRADKMDLATFLSRSALPESLLGALLPLYRLPDGFFNPPASVMWYQGGWMITAILAASLFLMLGRRRGPSGTVAPDRTAVYGGYPLDRALVAAATITLFFILLALGGNGLLYRLTYGIPIWSSFRWPFKFLLLANPLLAVTAGLAIEKCARDAAGGGRRLTAVGIGALSVILAVILLVRYPSPNLGTSAGMLCLAAGIPSLLLAGMVGARWARGALLAVVIVETVGVIALCHDLGFKTYQEPLGAYGPARLGIDADYRVLPLTVPELLGERPSVQPYDLFISATANGYDSATGCMWGMTPVWCAEVLPANVFGVLPPERSGALLGSNLLRSLNVRYVIAGRNDLRARSMVEKASGYRQVREVDGAMVFDNGDALPRAYFAGRVHPYSEAAFYLGMVLNQAPVRTAYAEGWGSGEQSWPVSSAAEVKSSSWTPNDVRFTIEAKDGGFLVVSMNYFPEWRALIDGRPARIYRVNGTLQGVAVPPGARTVDLHFRPTSFYLGVATAAFGIAILVGWLGFIRRQSIRSLPGMV
jgi:membrane protein YfhO